MSRIDSHRASRRRRATSLLSVEPLEGRTLLSLSMVKDINTVPAGPANITNVNGNIFFTTSAPDGGTDLDVRKASGTVVLKDFNTAASYTYGQRVSSLTAVGSQLFFVANGGQGEELWVSDGTVSGTHLVKDLNPGASSSNPTNLTAVGSELFFTVSNVPGVVPTGGYALYQSNGTAAGTIPVAKPLNSPASVQSMGATNLVSFKNKLYFATNTGQIDIATGTASGTSVLFAFNTPSGPARAPSHLTVVGSSLYFDAQDPSGNSALWKTDGTVAGTTLLRSYVAPPSANPYAYQPTLSNFTAVNGRLFFAADDNVNGEALWVSDGTSNGTTLVKTLQPSGANYFTTNGVPLGNMTAVGSTLFFTTATGAGTTGMQLWASDGTAAGTIKVKDVNPAVQDYSPTIIPGQFAAMGGSLYFTNGGPVAGLELWKSNGTVAGTVLVKDINPGAGSSFPGHMAVINNSLYFSATDGTGGSQLWKSNGTAAGTVKVQTISPVSSNPSLGDSFNGGANFAVLGGMMLFNAEDGIHGNELWRTDGSTGGTVLLRDLNPGALSSDPAHFVSSGGLVYFTTSAPQPTLWASNGTSAGTIALATLAGRVSSAVAFRSGVAFVENVNTNGTFTTQVWFSNGTSAGTRMLESFPTDSMYDVTVGGMKAVNGKLYFSGPSGPAQTPTTVWVSDGTNTSVLAANITNPGDFAVYNGKVVFAAADGANSSALWITDGTAGGTHTIIDLPANSELPSNLTVAGSNLYFFSAVAPAYSATLWKTNGTPGGTVQVTTLANNYVPDPSPVGLPNGKIVFEAGTKATSTTPSVFQPWVSDGTAAGTKVLKSIQADFVYAPARLINGLVYFSGSASGQGEELWQTDGTTAGTTLVQNLNPGAFSAFPSPLASVNGSLILVGSDGSHGYELFTLGNPSVAKPPTLLPVANQTIAAGSTLSLVVKAVDSNPSRVLNYSLAAGAPAGMTINASTGVLTWRPTVSTTVKVTVWVNDRNNPSLSVSGSFSITVT
jgi:ELWxxDGT repeat protein